MVRRWRSMVATAGVASLAALGSQGTAHAAAPDFNPIIDCIFTVTAAGNGMQILAPNGSTPVATLQTGQTYDLFNTTITRGNTFYWNDESFGQTGDWYPIRAADYSVIYMAKNENTCTLDNG